MSDTTPRTNGTEAQPVLQPQQELPEGLLERIIAESEKVFTARSARPSPIHLRTWEEIEAFAERAAVSDMVPKDFIRKPGAIAVAVMMGAELGLSPMQSLINISNINNRPAVFGDAMLGLVKASGHLREIQETIDGEGDARTATCTVWRVGAQKPVTKTFSVKDAKVALLWDKPGPWKQYPDRMMQFRARGFALRDAFPDVLRGLLTVEEARDIPPIITDQPITPPASKPPPAPPASAWVGKVLETLQKNANPQSRWLHFLLAAIARAPTRGELEALGEIKEIQDTLNNAPRAVRDQVEEVTADRMAFFDLEVTDDDDTEDHIPDDLKSVDADAIRCDKVIAAIAVSPSLEAIDKGILGAAHHIDWINHLSTIGRKDLINKMTAAREAREDELNASAP